MRSLATRFERGLARFAPSKPERLWVHFAFAICVFGTFVLLANALDRAALEKTQTAAQAISETHAQMALAAEVLELAERWEQQNSPDAIAMRDALGRLQALNAAGASRPAAPINVDPLQRAIAHFSAIARSIPDLPPTGVGAARRELRLLYRGDGLRDGVLSISATYADLISQEITDLIALRDRLAIAAVFILLAEALFVFWPAHFTIRRTIRKLQRQKEVLARSQDRIRQANERLEDLLRHDQLTGLPNRKSLIDYLDKAIIHRETSDNWLFLFGIDGFKAVNDTLGHDYGDGLLKAFGAALRDCTDDEDMIARVGGDEFAIVTAEDAAAILARIAAVLRLPIEANGRPILVRSSIGYLQIGLQLRKATDILADTELALQVAKTLGGARAQQFDTSLRTDQGLMQELQLELQDAIYNGEIEPWFQPQIDLSSGLLSGAEVLVRWQHPTRGLLLPKDFLGAAERAGLIVELDHTIWQTAMSLAHGWQVSGLWHPSISLNAAPDTIADPNMIERFLLSLQRAGLAANQVVIEVLETTLIESTDDMAAINIDQLAECGVALELDDFGTGYASLSKLTQLPVSGIKLDRSLVAPLPEHAADTVVRAILALAQELGLTVVAEGIEKGPQARYLGQSGCRIGQGYGFGKPMRADDFANWLRTYANLPSDLLRDEPPAAQQA